MQEMNNIMELDALSSQKMDKTRGDRLPATARLPGKEYVTQASRPGKKKRKKKKRSCVISACQLDSSSPNHIYAVIGHAWHFQGWPISDAACNEIRCMESPPWAYATFLFPGHWKKRGGESQSQSLKRTKPCFAGLHAFCSPIFPQNEAQEDAFTIRIRKHCFRFANQNTHRYIRIRSGKSFFRGGGRERRLAQESSCVHRRRSSLHDVQGGLLLLLPLPLPGVVAKRDH